MVKVNEIFQRIYKENGFKGKDSISGPGSDIEQTNVIRTEIPKLLKELMVQTLLDVPCGDLYWMKMVDLNNLRYIGGDIVKDIILKNIQNYGSKNMSFISLDLLKDPLPKADILLCRDCLVHMSYRNIFKALRNIKKSSIKYILTTSFTERDENINIRTGQWRPLNLMQKPFNFPDPLRIINENCTENEGVYKDKALVLWKISELPD